MQYVIHRSNDYLAHHGVKGQKHGERRYQNEDGSLTAEGREHYGVGESRYHGLGGQGYEARQAYKRGEITKEERKQATKAGNLLGKLDNISNLGFGRRIREFEARHKKGITAASAALSIAGTVAVGVLTGGSVPAIAHAGKAAVGAILGTALRTHVVNPLVLKYGYNTKFTANGMEDSYKPSNKRG